MADLKFKECEKPTALEDIKSGQLTDYIFMMYRKGEDGWYRNAILPKSEFKAQPFISGGFAGVRAMQSARISLDKNGKAAFIRAEALIERINGLGRAFGFAEVDSVNACYGLRELIKKERRFITEDSDLVAHIDLFSADETAAYPVKESMFTVSLEYSEKGAVKSESAIADICPVLSLEPGTARFENAVFTGKAGALAAGYDNVLWLDCVYRKFILGLGEKTVFFRIDGVIVTPPEKCGFTARAVKALIGEWGIPLEERRISADELWESYQKGKVSEIFAVSDSEPLCSVTETDLGDKVISTEVGKLARKLFDSISNIKRGVLISTALGVERI